MWDTGDALTTDREKLLGPRNVKDALKFIFEAHKTLDAIQCNALLNPTYKASHSPSYLEEMRTLRLWSQWANTFILVDKAELIPFNQGINFNLHKRENKQLINV
jgi:hypothetical protein